MSIILSWIVSTLIILACWGMIITMSAIYSDRASTLWGYTFFYTLLIDYIGAEFFIIYLSSKIVFKRQWDLEIADK